jgi:hypothetical protein
MKKNSFMTLGLPEKIFGIDRSFILLFLPPFVFIVVFLISLNLIFVPKITEIKTIGQKIKTVESGTIKINEQNNYLASIDQAELQKNADYLNDAILKDKKSYLLLGVIRSVSNRFNYQVESFSLSPGELKSGSDKSGTVANTVQLPLSVLMVGPKENSLELILALEKTLPILFIDKFETKTSGDSTQMDLTVHSYYINDEVNINTDKITLNDLILSSQESALLDKISGFTKIDNGQLNVGTSEFQQYNRENPFSF